MSFQQLQLLQLHCHWQACIDFPFASTSFSVQCAFWTTVKFVTWPLRQSAWCLLLPVGKPVHLTFPKALQTKLRQSLKGFFPEQFQQFHFSQIRRCTQTSDRKTIASGLRRNKEVSLGTLTIFTFCLCKSVTLETQGNLSQVAMDDFLGFIYLFVTFWGQISAQAQNPDSIPGNFQHF